MRLSPFDPLSFSAYLALGHARFREQRYDDAAAFYSKGAQANPRFSSLYGRQAAALALAGRIGEAKLVGRRLLELDPGFRIQRHLSNIRFAVPEVLNGLARAWRDIGLPE